jgi:hypothetical protein
VSDEPNEILATAAAAKQHEMAAKQAKRERKGWDLGKIGLGVGIGSAAVAAAVLFANRNKD